MGRLRFAQTIFTHTDTQRLIHRNKCRANTDCEEPLFIANKGVTVIKILRLVGTALLILSLQFLSTVTHAAAIPGQIIVDPEHPMWLKYSGGGPFFLAGPGDPEDFLYRGTRSFDGTRIGDQTALINKLRDTGANSIYFQALRSHGGDGDPTHNPFVDPSNSNSDINLAILDQWETWFTAMDNNEIVIFFFFYDDAIRISENISLGWPLDSLGDLHVRERNYIETLVNRFKHHKYLIWVVMEEVQEMGSDYVAHVKKIAQVISQADDQDHVIAVHKNSGLIFSEFADDPNIDQFALQDNAATSAPDFHEDMVTAWNNASGRYNLNMAESSIQPGKTGDTLRKENWAIAMGGAYVMVYGMDIQNTDINDLQDLGRLRSFMESTNFNTMAPHDELAFGGTEYVLGNPGSSYIAYASSLTGNIGLKGMTPGAYDFNWYDVTNGSTVVQSNVNLPAGDQVWSTPFGIGNELAVFIERRIVNTAPVALNDSASTTFEAVVSISVLTNDTDAERDALTVTALTQPTNGSVAFNPDDTVTYTPDTGFSGTDTFTYTANDGQLDSNIASVIVIVDPQQPPPNQAPSAIAGPDQTRVDSDGNGTENITLDGLGSSDPDGIIESYEWREGTTLLATGVDPLVSLTVGTHTIDLTVTDDGGATANDTVIVKVDPQQPPPNQAPSANAGPDQTRVDNDGNGTENITLDGLGSSDSDGTIENYEWREGATLLATGVNPLVSLTVGTHTIDLTVTDDGNATSIDTVVISVQASPLTGPDFNTQVVKITIPAGASSVISSAFDAVDSSRTLALISGITQQAMGWTAETTQDPVEISANVELSVDGTTITATRASAMSQPDIVWVLLIEYTGPVGGANELLVRDRRVHAWAEGQASTSYGPISSTVNGNKVVVFGAGSSNSNIGSSQYDRGDVRAWIDGTNTVQLVRGDGSGVISSSHQVVEFVGSNWNIQTGDTAPSPDPGGTDVVINSVNNVSNAWVYFTWSSNSANLDERGHRVWLNSSTILRVQEDAAATGAKMIRWAVISNPQMQVQTGAANNLLNSNSSGTITGFVSVVDLTQSFAWVSGMTDGGGNAHPRDMWQFELLDSSTINLQRGRTGQELSYRYFVVELPTDGGTGGNNLSPLANAGSDQIGVDSDGNGTVIITLDGSGSSDPDGTIESFEWREGATLLATGVNPLVSLTVGTHTIDLTITDDGDATATDTVIVTIDPQQPPPNQAPSANAGPDQTRMDSDGNGTEGITLDGSASSDPDGIIANYEWREGATLLATGVNTPVLLTVGTHTIDLTVTDDGGTTANDTVIVTIDAQNPPPNQAPSAAAGPDQSVVDNDGNGTEGITLDGSASSDPDGTIASYEWREGGTLVATGVNPLVSLTVGTHTIDLTVTDDGDTTSIDTVVISVQPSPLTGADFNTQVVKITIPAGASSVLSSAFDSVDSSRTLALISGVTQQAMGWTAETTQDPVEISANVELSVDGTTITATRASAMNQPDIVWVLLIAYTGPVGGANELLVRDRRVHSWSAGQASTSYGPISFVGDASKVVVFGAGSSNSNAGSSQYDLGDVRAWLDGDNNVQLVRGDGSGVISSSHQVVEFVGSNWNIQTGDTAPSPDPGGTDVVINSVNNVSNAWVYFTWSSNSANLDERGHRVWLNSSTILRVQEDAAATGAKMIRWAVISNPQMQVQSGEANNLLNSTNSGTITEFEPVVDMSRSFAWVSGMTNGGGNAHPRDMWQFELFDSSTINLQRGRTGQELSYRYFVVELPTDGAAGGGNNQSPMAIAGSDQTLLDSDGNGTVIITLDGSGSSDPDGTIESFEWREGATLLATGVNPLVSLTVGTHTIDLTITDDGDATATDTVIVTVDPQQPPLNQAPSANAGPDQTLVDSDDNGTEDVTLDGSASSDADGTIANYEWREGATLLATGVNPIVSLAAGTHTIELSVTDDIGATSTDTVIVTVNGATPACTGNAVCSFVLYNSDTDMSIRTLADGVTVSISADCSNDPTKCNIEAVVASPEGATQSVRLDLNGGSIRTENGPPYLLGGDTAAGANIDPIPLPGLVVGTSTVNATPFSGNSGSGTAGTAGSVTFNVVP